MPRLFTALEIPANIAMQLSFMQGGLPGARWIDRENFHITLRFIGDVEKPLAREILHAMEWVKAGPFQLQLRDLDVFGGSKPHSLFAGVEGSADLMALQGAQERICQRLGLEPEGRKYKPHVTIARLRGAKVPDIAKYLSARGGYQSLPFEVSRFVLLSSRDSVGGGPYHVEDRFDLVDRAFEYAS